MASVLHDIHWGRWLAVSVLLGLCLIFLALEVWVKLSEKGYIASSEEATAQAIEDRDFSYLRYHQSLNIEWQAFLASVKNARVRCTDEKNRKRIDNIAFFGARGLEYLKEHKNRKDFGRLAERKAAYTRKLKENIDKIA